MMYNESCKFADTKLLHFQRLRKFKVAECNFEPIQIGTYRFMLSVDLNLHT